MDRSDVIYLISKTYVQDAYGVQRESETRKRVFCSVRSASHKEKTENGLLGLNSAYSFSVFKYDYSGEEVVEYNGQKYIVYDATEYNDLMRLYCQSEQGA